MWVNLRYCKRQSRNKSYKYRRIRYTAADAPKGRPCFANLVRTPLRVLLYQTFKKTVCMFHLYRSLSNLQNLSMFMKVKKYQRIPFKEQ